MSLDTIDVKILEVLQSNARISVSELSKQVNLSLSAVSERLKKLESSGVIEEYTTIIKPSAMEKELSVLMLVSLESTTGTAVKELQLFVDNADEILECHHITGEYDYALKITTKNTETLEKLMSTIKSISGVRHCQTNVILSSSKKRYSVRPVAAR
ncbi:MAG: Lrp/AsnC family transcriptional regulator [Bacillota bacterium]|nr:Lrp/AsnC family transcriptional regulator [Bacillota bacterium]